MNRREPTATSDADRTNARPGASTEPQVDVGLLVAHSPQADTAALRSFAQRMVDDGVQELRSVTDLAWGVDTEEPLPLPDRSTRRASEFVDDAAVRMVEGPYDLLVVVTDVPLISRRREIVPGLASPVGRIVVVSTHKLLIGPREEPFRTVDSEAMRWNAATLLLHLLGHVFGARHGADDGGVMEPFRFEADRRSVPEFDLEVGTYLRRVATGIPDEETTLRGPLDELVFHGVSAVRNPSQVGQALLHSRAPLLPLSLPKIATAAVTPTLILVFSAETWDVGLHLPDLTAGLFALGSVLAAAVHLMFVQNISFPRRGNRVLTEHVALVNVTAFLILVGAMVGLFGLVGVIILLIELLVFPPDLMTNWPSLENPVVEAVDLVRTAVFISSIGVLSGALAGGIENRAVLHQLALFLDRP